MADFSINEMQEMQRALQEKYKHKWEPICAEIGQNKLLWMIGEIGEVIDIVKKYGGTKESPVHINTTDSRTFVDYNTDASTIANGGLIIHHDGYILNGAAKVEASTDQWVEYTIPLNYHNLEKQPTHLIISCAASQFGDYFTGYSNSKLWIDAVELVY